MPKLLILDTFNFLHRAYHALPLTLTDKSGNPTNAVYGVTSMIITVLSQVEPQYVIAALDSKEKTKRAEKYADYKAHRKPMDKELAEQIPKVLNIIESFGITTLQASGHEADDLIATVTRKYEGEMDVVVVSNDRDLWQLTDKKVIIMVPSKGNTIEWIGRSEASARFGFSPEKIADYKGLCGDTSDNIPGVRGIGAKTATRLLTEYESIEDIYSHLDEITPESLRNKLKENQGAAYMSKDLAELVTDIDLGLDIESCKYSKFSLPDIKALLEEYNFKSLIRRLGYDNAESKSKSSEPEIHENQLSLL